MEVAKEFEISGNVCFGKPKCAIQKNNCHITDNKISRIKRTCDVEPSRDEIIKVPRLQKDKPNRLEGTKISKKKQRPAFKIKIKPFNMAAKKNTDDTRRCSK